MRRWMMMKKQIIGEMYKERDDDDGEEEKEFQSVLQKIKEKAKFLISIKTPKIFDSEDQKDLSQLMRRPSYLTS